MHHLMLYLAKEGTRKNLRLAKRKHFQMEHFHMTILALKMKLPS